MIWKNHKLIVDIFKDETYFELYDLENDVQETRNLVAAKEKMDLSAVITKKERITLFFLRLPPRL